MSNGSADLVGLAAGPAPAENGHVAPTSIPAGRGPELAATPDPLADLLSLTAGPPAPTAAPPPPPTGMCLDTVQLVQWNQEALDCIEVHIVLCLGRYASHYNQSCIGVSLRIKGIHTQQHTFASGGA